MALATLTIDLVAKLATIERDMGKAAQIAQKNADKMEKAFAGASKAFAAIGAGVSVGAFASMIKGVAESADAVRRLSQLSGAGTEEFQRFSAGAKSVGFESEKMADVFKDVNDKVGEFLATGGGPLKDFFENIAPRINLTADAFKGLSGPQALQLYASSLEKANLSQAETTFYMEALANDATALIPLLANGGAKMREFGDAAADAGAIMDDKLIKSSGEFKRNMDELEKTLQGVRNQIGNVLIPEINRLSQEFYDGRDAGLSFWEAVSGIGFSDPSKSAAEHVARITKELDKLQNGKWFEKSLFQTIGGEDLVGQLQKELAYWQKQASRAQDAANRKALEGFDDGVGRPMAAANTRSPSSTPKTPKGARKAASPVKIDLNLGEDTEAGSAYARAMESIAKAQLSAEKSGLQLGAAQSVLYDLMRAPEWARMPEAWKQLVIDQTAAAVATDGLAKKNEELRNQMARLDELVAAPGAMVKSQREDMLLLAEAFEKGKISVEQYTESVMARLGTDVPQAAKDASDAMSEFTKNFAASAQGTIADLLFTGAEEGFDGLVDNFGRALQRMAAEAAAAKIMESIFGASFGKTGKVDVGSLLGIAASVFSMGSGVGAQQAPAPVFDRSFAGGGWTGSGPRTGGIDGKGGFPAILHPRETVIDHTKGQRVGGTTTINVTVQGGSAPDVRRAAGQGAREALSVMGGAQRYQ